MNHSLLIYGLADPRTGAIHYIGKSTSGMRRPLSHFNERSLKLDGNTLKVRWLRELTTSGLKCDVRVLEAIESDPDGEMLGMIERFWIAQGREAGWPLFNIRDGGDGWSGRDVSDETRKRIGSANKKRWESYTDEERKKFSLMRSKIGRTLANLTHLSAAREKAKTPTAIAKMSAAMRGRKLSKEWVERISAASKARMTKERSLALTAAAQTEQSRAKRSHSLMGHIVTLEARAKISASNRGRDISELSRERMSQAHIGMKPTAETIAKRADSLREAWARKRPPPSSGFLYCSCCRETLPSGEFAPSVVKRRYSGKCKKCRRTPGAGAEQEGA